MHGRIDHFDQNDQMELFSKFCKISRFQINSIFTSTAQIFQDEFKNRFHIPPTLSSIQTICFDYGKWMVIPMFAIQRISVFIQAIIGKSCPQQDSQQIYAVNKHAIRKTWSIWKTRICQAWISKGLKLVTFVKLQLVLVCMKL